MAIDNAASFGHIGHLPADVNSKWVRTDNLPPMALQACLTLRFVGWPSLREFFDETASGRRGVEKQDAAGFGAGVLPGMRDFTRHECTCTGTTDGDLVSNHEGEFAGQYPCDLVAVVMQMVEACAAGRQGLLEHHDAFVGLMAEQLQVKEAAGSW